MPVLGKYRVEWEYDPMKHNTYCVIRDSEGETIVEAKATMHPYRSHYDKVRARIVTFNKALKELAKRKLLNAQEISDLKERFRNLPNKGVV